MTNVKSKAFDSASALVTFMNTVAVTTVISVVYDTASSKYVIIFQ